MTQEEIIRMAREAGFEDYDSDWHMRRLERFAALVAAHAKSDQINTAYQQGCEDMKRRMEKRIHDLESQLQVCRTAVADEREACAKVCETAMTTNPTTSMFEAGANSTLGLCVAAIRARSEK